MRVPSRDEAVALARQAVEARFSSAVAAVAAGSLVRGAGVAHSDIDLVILFDALPQAWRESFAIESTQVEAFVHDPQTLRWFMAKDAEQGRPVMLTMLAEGVAIGPRPDAIAPLQAEAAAMLAKGPAALSDEARDAMRYRISDMLVDLEDARPVQEMRALGAQLYQAAADLMLLGRGRWTGAGKWTPRRLHLLDADLATRCDTAFTALFTSGEADAVIALVDAELARHGGRLFEGFRQDAPADNRLT